VSVVQRIHAQVFNNVRHFNVDGSNKMASTLHLDVCQCHRQYSSQFPDLNTSDGRFQGRVPSGLSSCSICMIKKKTRTALFRKCIYSDIFFFFYVLLTAHPNLMIIFFSSLIHKFIILIHLLHFSTCFEHYCAHLQEDNCINTASGIVTVFG